jgi:hypothetical protein
MSDVTMDAEGRAWLRVTPAEVYDFVAAHRLNRQRATNRIGDDYLDASGVIRARTIAGFAPPTRCFVDAGWASITPDARHER